MRPAPRGRQCTRDRMRALDDLDLVVAAVVAVVDEAVLVTALLVLFLLVHVDFFYPRHAVPPRGLQVRVPE